MLDFFKLVLCKIRILNLFNLLSSTKYLRQFLWIIQIACCILYTNNLSADNTIDTSKSNSLDTFRVSKDALDAIIEYHADDSTLFDLANRKAYLWGNARVKYEGMDLKAYLIVVDFGKRELYAKGRINDSTGKYVGRPLFNDGERETEADTMIYNFDTKRGRTYGIAMKEGDGFILCNKVFRDNDNSIYSDLGKYTTCNNKSHPHFYLQSRNLKIIPDNKIIFGPSNLVIEEIPTPLYLPFGLFPTKKGEKSGLIPFEYGSSGLYGPYLRNLGYHFAINDYLDQSITGDIYFRGSWRIASNTRYVKRYKYNGNFNIEFSKYLNGEKEDLNFKQNTTRTFRLAWRHNQDPKANPGSSFSSNVDIQKNNASRLNSLNASTIVTNEFGSSVSYSKTLVPNKLDLRLSALHRQNTSTNAFSMTLPNLTLSMQRITPFSKPDVSGRYKWYKDFGVSYIVEMENRIDTKDSIFFSGKPLESILPGFSINSPISLKPSDGFKQGVIHSIPITLGSYKLIKQHFSLTPTVSYREFWYFRTIEKQWNSSLEKLDTIYHDDFSRASDYSANVALATQIFGTMQFAGGKVSAIRHNITPQLSFSYRPDYASEKFAYYKTVQSDTGKGKSTYSIYEQGIKGSPQPGASGLMNFLIINKIQAKVFKKTDSTAKYENVTWIENFNISGNYNFLADTQKLSKINITGFTRIFKQVSLNANAVLNPYAKKTLNNGKEFYLNSLEWSDSRRIGTWTNATIQLASGINADMFRKKKSNDTSGLIKTEKDRQEYAEMMGNPYGYVNFDLPWSINVNYSLIYNRSNFKSLYTQTFNLKGDFNLTPKWKIGCSSGYDFGQKKIAYTQFDISRLLHCWALNFSWIPDGIRKSFTFSLRVNSGMLQSLKVDKKRNWFDQ